MRGGGGGGRWREEEEEARVGGGRGRGDSARIWYGNAGVGVQFVPLESRKKNQQHGSLCYNFCAVDGDGCDTRTLSKTHAWSEIAGGFILKLFFSSRALTQLAPWFLLCAACCVL